MSNSEQRLSSTLERSTRALFTATANLSKVTAELQDLTNVATELAQDIEFKQREINEADEKLQVQIRTAKAELNLKVLENESEVLGQLLTKAGLISVQPGFIQELEETIQALKKQGEAEVKAAVAFALKEKEQEYTLKTLQTSSEATLAITQKDAQIAHLTDRVTYLETENAKKDKQIADELSARVTIATSESAQKSVVINTSNTK